METEENEKMHSNLHSSRKENCCFDIFENMLDFLKKCISFKRNIAKVPPIFYIIYLSEMKYFQMNR